MNSGINPALAGFSFLSNDRFQHLVALRGRLEGVRITTEFRLLQRSKIQFAGMGLLTTQKQSLLEASRGAAQCPLRASVAIGMSVFGQ